MFVCLPVAKHTHKQQAPKVHTHAHGHKKQGNKTLNNTCNATNTSFVTMPIKKKAKQTCTAKTKRNKKKQNTKKKHLQNRKRQRVTNNKI